MPMKSLLPLVLALFLAACGESSENANVPGSNPPDQDAPEMAPGSNPPVQNPPTDVQPGPRTGTGGETQAKPAPGSQDGGSSAEGSGQ
jgi:hypothetical protein